MRSLGRGSLAAPGSGPGRLRFRKRTAAYLAPVVTVPPVVVPIVPNDLIGHGQFGLRDRLRTFRDLQLDTTGDRRPYADLAPGIELSGFVLHSGSVYRIAITNDNVNIAGVIRPIVEVQTLLGDRVLTRVDALSQVVAGTWFYDDEVLTYEPGSATNLYVHLPGDVSPSTTTVVALLLISLGTADEVHPLISGDRLPDGGVEQWTGSSTLAHYNVQNTGVGGVQLTQETVNPYAGSFSAKISPTVGGLAPGSGGGINTLTLTVADDAMYLFAIAYLTDPDMPAQLQARWRFRFGPLAPAFASDGLSLNVTTPADGIPLRNTDGEWRRAFFMTRVPAGSGSSNFQIGARIFNRGTTFVTDGYAIFDELRMWRVYRFIRYEARITATSLPACEVKSPNMLFAGSTVGIGDLTIADAGEDLKRDLARLLLLNKPVNVFVGGVFSNGEEIYRDDWRPQFPGLTGTPTFRDGTVSFRMSDARIRTRGKLLESQYRRIDLPNLDPNADGAWKRLVFGQSHSDSDPAEHLFDGVRVDVGAEGYGHYSLLDERVPLTDGVSVVLPLNYSIKVYPNKELADQDLKGYVITDNVNDFDVINNNTLWRIKRDVRNLRYNRAGDDVGTDASFTIKVAAGATVTAHFDVSGPPYKSVADLQTALRAAAGVTNIDVTYNETTHLVRITKNGIGNLVLKMAGGPPGGGAPGADVAEAPQKQSFGIYGFNTNTDITIAGTGGFVDADVPLFIDPETSHVIRFVGGGYRDDATGSIAGLANAAIQTPPAIAAWLIRKRLREPAVKVNATSFSIARDTCDLNFIILFAPLSGDEDVYATLSWLCQVGLMVINIDGAGVWTCKVYDPTALGVRSFYDFDYLDFVMWQEPSTIYAQVRVQGGYHAARRVFRTYADASTMDPGIPLKYGTDQILNLSGYLAYWVITGGLQTLTFRLGNLVQRIPRHVTFSCAGKLVDLLLGDKIYLSKTGAFDITGNLSSVPFRITALSHDYLTGVSTCTAVEDIDYTAIIFS